MKLSRFTVILVILGALTVGTLVGCSGSDEESTTDRFVPARPVGSIVTDTVSGAAEGTFKAAKQPLEDVGLTREEIPSLLLEVAQAPYRKPSPLTCELIQQEIAALDVILGPDVCTADNPIGARPSRKGEYVEEGASFARKQAVDMASGYLDVLPFRGVVRRVSGADKHAKAVSRAYEIGKARRAFLKGLAAQMEPACETAKP